MSSSNTGVEGNKEADYLAKDTAHEDRVKIALQYGLSEHISIMKKMVKEMW